MEKRQELEKILESTGKFLVESTDTIKSYDVKDESLFLYPYGQSFQLMYEPIEDFLIGETETRVKVFLINERRFAMVGYEHFNTTIYELKLKLV